MLFLCMARDIERYFSDLGMKPEEAKVYLACLKRPNGLFVHEIVRNTNIKRSTTDLILNRLRKCSFVSRHRDGARWVYCAEPPEKISFSFEKKLEGFRTILPLLMKQFHTGALPVVRFFEGNEGLEQLFDDILLTCKALPMEKRELLIISSGYNLLKALPEHEQRFIKKRVKQNISVRILAPNDKITQQIYKTDPMSLRKTKFFDGKTYPFSVEMNIYADKIALLDFSDSGATGTIIQNSEITSSVNSLFRMLWAE